MLFYKTGVQDFRFVWSKSGDAFVIVRSFNKAEVSRDNPFGASNISNQFSFFSSISYIGSYIGN